eukprot:Ihof_evm2s627 gene=Ihof_evmTU2s627
MVDWLLHILLVTTLLSICNGALLAKSSVELCRQDGTEEIINPDTGRTCTKKMVVLLSVASGQANTETLEASISTVTVDGEEKTTLELMSALMILLSKQPVVKQLQMGSQCPIVRAFVVVVLAVILNIFQEVAWIVLQRQEGGVELVLTGRRYLRFSGLSYNAYEVSSPIQKFDIQVDLKKFGTGDSADVPVNEQLVIGPNAPGAQSKDGGLMATYVGTFAPSAGYQELGFKYLVKPSPISTDTGNEQLQERRKNNRTPLYFVDRYGGWNGLDIDLNDKDRVALSYVTDQMVNSVVTLTLVADDIAYVTNVSPGEITKAEIKDFQAITNDGKLDVSIKNTGYLIADYYIRVDACTNGIIAPPSQRMSIESQQIVSRSFKIIANVDLDKDHQCTVNLDNSEFTEIHEVIVKFRTNQTEIDQGDQGGVTPDDKDSQLSKGMKIFVVVLQAIAGTVLGAIVLAGAVILLSKIFPCLIPLAGCLQSALCCCCRIFSCCCSSRRRYEDEEDDEREYQRRRRRQARKAEEREEEERAEERRRELQRKKRELARIEHISSTTGLLIDSPAEEIRLAPLRPASPVRRPHTVAVSTPTRHQSYVVPPVMRTDSKELTLPLLLLLSQRHAPLFLNYPVLDRNRTQGLIVYPGPSVSILGHIQAEEGEPARFFFSPEQYPNQMVAWSEQTGKAEPLPSPLPFKASKFNQ